MAKSANLLSSIDIVFDNSKTALNRQFEQSSSLDMKLGISIGLSGVILAALLGLQGLNAYDMVTTWLIILAVTLVILSLIFAAYGVFLIGKFQWAPRPEALRKFYLTTSARETKLVIIDTQIEVYIKNRNFISRKARMMKLSFYTVLCSAFVIGIAILYNLA